MLRTALLVLLLSPALARATPPAPTTESTTHANGLLSSLTQITFQENGERATWSFTTFHDNGMPYAVNVITYDADGTFLTWSHATFNTAGKYQLQHWANYDPVTQWLAHREINQYRADGTLLYHETRDYHYDTTSHESTNLEPLKVRDYYSYRTDGSVDYRERVKYTLVPRIGMYDKEEWWYSLGGSQTGYSHNTYVP